MSTVDSSYDFRIFIGNIPSDVHQSDLENRFTKYGVVSKMILNRAKQFAYIRYTNKESMLAAIKGENGENYKGKYLKVNEADEILRPPTRPSPGSRILIRNLPPNFNQTALTHVFAAYGDIIDNEFRENVVYIGYEAHSAAIMAASKENKSTVQGRMIDVLPIEYGPGESQRVNSVPDWRAFPGIRVRQLPRNTINNELRDRFEIYGRITVLRSEETTVAHGGSATIRFSREDEMAAAIRCEDGADYAGSKISVYALSDSKDKNDAFGVTGGGNVVEIICQSKQVRVYAEYIEGLISGKGIKVDLMFPNLTYPITDILADMMKRGVLFVINVSLLDEQNRTATVLRLKENTTKSFPVAEAINFVISKYKEISTPLSLQNQDSVYAASGGQNVEPSCLPRDIQTIVDFLVDDRDLSTMEYDKLIRFLVKTREDTLNKEYGGNIPPHLLLPPVAPTKDPLVKMKQEELQASALEILATTDYIPSLTDPKQGLQQSIDALYKSIVS